MTYDPQECSRILSLRTKATPPEWRISGDHIDGADLYIVCKRKNAANNIAFIAAAHSMADQIEALQEIVEKQRAYLWHKPDCDFLQNELPCTCGLEELTQESHDGQ